MATVAIAAFLVLVAQPGLTSRAQEQTHVPNEVIVKYRPGVGAQSADDYSQALAAAGVNYQYQESLYGSQVSAASTLHNTFVVKLTEGESVEDTVAKLEAQAQVVYAEPNAVLEAFFTPNDPQWSSLWGMSKIQADSAWDVQAGRANVTVAVIDTGVDLNHPDLQGKLVPGYDFVGGDNNPSDGHGHGTHVSGTVAAITNNAQDVAGIAGGDAAQGNLGVQIMPVRVLNSSGSGSMAAVARGIQWAADNGAHVINMSLGDPNNRRHQTMQDAVTYAWNQGVVVVAAAGNSGRSTCFPPAKYNESICVIATTSSDGKASFSNYGQGADVGAPGSSILSLWRGGGTRSASGTSMASPHVAGLAGLLYSFMPTRSTANAQAVRGCIENNLDVPAGWSTSWAPGRINALRAVNDGSCNTGAPTPTLGPSVAPSPTPGSGSPSPTVAATPTTSPVATPSVSPTAGLTPPPYSSNCAAADLNADNTVDQSDLDALLNSFGGSSSDINGDGVVNGIDAGIVLACWGWQGP